MDGELSRLSNEVAGKLFGDILSELTNVDLLFFSPDLSLTVLPISGMLHICNFPVLNHLKVISTPSTSILCRKNTKRYPFATTDALLMGDPMPFDLKKELYNASEIDKQMISSFRDISVQKTKHFILKNKNPDNIHNFSFVFKRIPYTQKEIESIQQLCSGAGIKQGVLLQERFIKYNVIASMDASPSIIHFATHAIVSNDIPYLLEPAIVVSGSGRIINHFLLASEIERLDLEDTSLVVLSACKSGVDSNYDSEGISGIAKSFLIAGAQNIVLTLWSIDDQATNIFMSYFYKAVFRGRSIQSALNEAKILMMQHKEYCNPYYWAGFVLYGTG